MFDNVWIVLWNAQQVIKIRIKMWEIKIEVKVGLKIQINNKTNNWSIIRLIVE